MPHKKAEKSGERRVISLSYHAVELFVLLMRTHKRELHGKAVHRVEVVAGQNRTCVECGKIFAALYLFYDKIAVFQYRIKVSFRRDVGAFREHTRSPLSAEVVNLARHYHSPRRVVLNVLVKASLVFVEVDSVEDLLPVLGAVIPFHTRKKTVVAPRLRYRQIHKALAGFGVAFPLFVRV